MTKHGDPGVDAGTVAAAESVDCYHQRWRHSPAAAAHAPAGHPRQHPALLRAAAPHHQRPAAVTLAVELSTKLRKQTVYNSFLEILLLNAFTLKNRLDIIIIIDMLIKRLSNVEQVEGPCEDFCEISLTALPRRCRGRPVRGRRRGRCRGCAAAGRRRGTAPRTQRSPAPAPRPAAAGPTSACGGC